MNGESSYFKLGLFVLTGFALLVVGVVALGVGAMFTHTVRVTTVTFDSVQGLDVGAPVKFRGVTVGKVGEMSMILLEFHATDMQERVKAGNQIMLALDIDRKYFQGTTLPEIRANVAKAAEAGFRARITSAGLAGPPYIEVLFLNPEKYPPPDIAIKPDTPYVPSAPSSMSRLAEDVGSIADAIKRADLQTVIGHADRLLVSADKAVNDAKVAELQRRLDGMLGELDASARRLRAILADPKIDALLADASSTMTSVNNVVNGNDVKAAVGDLPRITGGARSAIARVDEMVRSPQLQKTLDNVHQATGTADVSLTELRRGLRSVNELFSSERGQIEQTLGSLRRTLENVEALIADLKRNPSRAIFGSPPRHLNPGERQ